MPPALKTEHVYHHDDDKPRFAVKVEHNSRGTNWEIGVSNCSYEFLEEALKIVESTEQVLKAKYEQTPVISGNTV